MGGQPEAGGSGPGGEGGQAVNTAGVFYSLRQWRIKDFFLWTIKCSISGGFSL